MLKIYGRPSCSNCQTTKKILDAKNTPYEWVDVDENPEIIAWIRKNGWTPLPMIETGDERWNGLNINKLNEYIQKYRGE